jgi:hypothetical protein
MENKNLMEYFKFDESDLNANRNGSLTEKQKIRLTDELRSARRKKTILAYSMFLLGAIGVVGAVAIWFIPGSSWGLRVGFGIGFGLVWPAVYIFMGLIFLPSALYMDLELANVTGRVNIVRVESHHSNSHTTSSRYDLYIGNRRFAANFRIGNILMQGDEYTVYYLLNSQRIVSAEFISAGK